MAIYNAYLSSYLTWNIEPKALWLDIEGTSWERKALERSVDGFRYSMTNRSYGDPIVFVFEMTGSNFRYDWSTGLPKAGTLETITGYRNGELSYSVTGFSTPLVPSTTDFLERILSGDDYLTAPDEDGNLFGHSGSDTMIGGAGADYLTGDNWNASNPGDDRLYGNGGYDVLEGGGGRDYLDGGDGADVMRGGDGHDTLVGGAGADHMQGDAGNDRLIGGAGNDRLEGGRSRDVLIGGEGADGYVYGWKIREESSMGTAYDTIHFEQADGDIIDLSAADAITDGNPNSRWDSFLWVDERDLGAAFTGRAGQLRFANGWLMGDTTGDAVADFRIQIIGTLGVADVIL
jgi:Ca2+-binding RTX toxin-like protein